MGRGLIWEGGVGMLGFHLGGMGQEERVWTSERLEVTREAYCVWVRTILKDRKGRVEGSKERSQKQQIVE